MFIETETTPYPARLKFLPGCPVMEKGTADFADANDARRSPLATALFGVEGITRVFLGSDFITVTKSSDKDWDIMKTWILGTIMKHFLSGQPVIAGSAAAPDPAESGGEDPIGAQIKDLIDTRIRPAATQDGGDVTFRGFKDGVVYLEFHGSASGLMNGIENMLRHYVPEVEAVKDHRDALPKPGLETPEGKAEYVDYQRAFAAESQQLREQLLQELAPLLNAAAMSDSATAGRPPTPDTSPKDPS